MPKLTIMDIVAQRYPEIDPRYALLGLYYKQGDIYAVGKLLGVHPSGIYRHIRDIEKDMLINGLNSNGGGK